MGGETCVGNVSYMGCTPMDFETRCRYLDSEEDVHKTTIYPVCTGRRCNCDNFRGYCPVRDDRS